MIPPIRIAHVEDDLVYANQCRDVLQTHSAYEYLGYAHTAAQGLELINSVHPHIVLLDVELGDQSRLWLAKQLKTSNTMLVFCSNYNHYAVEAFKYFALHFIPKPATIADFDEVAQRFTERGQMKNYHQEERINSLIAALENSKLPEKIYVNSQKSIDIIDLKDLSYIYANGNYSHLVKGNGEEVIASKNLKSYTGFLEKHPHFVRIHRCYIVNQNHIAKITKDGITMTFHFKNGQHVKVTSFRKDAWLKNFLNE
jgi:two-component system, LytTR family, response regulator